MTARAHEHASTIERPPALGRGPWKIAVLIPTTRHPVTVTALKVRTQLPTSHVLAGGDYRPLPISADYDQLVGVGGPIGARLDGRGQTSWELRISERFDSGRSWEVPVSLAHLLTARGHTLVEDIASADLVLWSTGAVDADLGVSDQNYFLEDKINASAAALARGAARGKVIVLLPDAPAQPVAAAMAQLLELRAAGVAVHPIRSIDDALGYLQGSSTSAVSPSPRASDIPPRPASPPSRATNKVALAAVAALLIGGGGFGVSKILSRPAVPTPAPAPAVVPKPDAASAATATPKPSAPPAAATTQPAAAPAPVTPAAAPPVVPAVATLPAAPPTPDPTRLDPALVIEEHRAPQQRTCIDVLFGGARAVVRELRPAAGKFEPSRLAGLCGLVVRIADPALAGSVEVDAALLEASIPGIDGAADGRTRISRIIKDGAKGARTYHITTRPPAKVAGATEGQFSHELID